MIEIFIVIALAALTFGYMPQHGNSVLTALTILCNIFMLVWMATGDKTKFFSDLKFRFRIRPGIMIVCNTVQWTWYGPLDDAYAEFGLDKTTKIWATERFGRKMTFVIVKKLMPNHMFFKNALLTDKGILVLSHKDMKKVKIL